MSELNDFLERMSDKYPEIMDIKRFPTTDSVLDFLDKKGELTEPVEIDDFAKGGRVGFDMGGMSYKDVEERYAEGLTQKEYIRFIELSPAERREEMTRAGVLRDDMADGGRVNFNTGSSAGSFGEVRTDIALPAPFIESAGKAFLTKLEKGLDPGAAIKTREFAPSVADQNKLQQAALRQAAESAGLGALTFDSTGVLSGVGTGDGVASFEPFVTESQRLAGIDPVTGQTTAAGLTAARDPFMTPFQQQVIDATKASFEQQRARDRLNIADAAVGAGAFGGARQGVQEGVYDAETALGLAGLEAQLLQQNFAQADAARMAALQNQQGVAQAVPQLETQQFTQLSQLGAGQQAIQQAQLDAQAAEDREAAYEEQQRQGFFGQQIAPFTGGFGAQQQFSTTTQPPPSTLNTILGVGTMAGGLLGGIGSFLGRGATG